LKAFGGDDRAIVAPAADLAAPGSNRGESGCLPASPAFVILVDLDSGLS